MQTTKLQQINVRDKALSLNGMRTVYVLQQNYRSIGPVEQDTKQILLLEKRVRNFFHNTNLCLRLKYCNVKDKAFFFFLDIDVLTY